MTLDRLMRGQRARIVAVDRAALVEEEPLRLQEVGIDAGALNAIANHLQLAPRSGSAEA